jgi:hypothetical protein
LAVCGIVLLVSRFPDPLDRRDTPAVLERDRTMAGLMRALELEDLKKDEPVFLTTIGYVGVTTLTYEFLKHHLPMPRFFDLALSDDPSEFPAMIDQAAFVIATDKGNDEVFYTAPSAFIQAETLAMVQRNPAFIEVARFNTWRGKHYYLFGRRTRAKPADGTAAPDIPAPGPVLLYGISSGAPGDWRWSRREFAIEFPAPRGLRAELKLRLILPQANIEKLGPVTLDADIPQEGRHSETFANGGGHEFTYRYTIRKHLVSTVVVRFRLNKALPSPQGSGGELGLLFGSAELNPIGELRERSIP